MQSSKDMKTHLTSEKVFKWNVNAYAFVETKELMSCTQISHEIGIPDSTVILKKHGYKSSELKTN